MDNKSQYLFKIVFGVVIIGGVIFVAFKYLWKGSPPIKVMALGLIVGTSYLVINYLIKKNKET
jgi:hypothetical protein